MRISFSLAIMASLLILLTSCASTNYYEQTINSWRGSSIQDLVKSWGEPNQIIKSADGSQIISYITKRPLYFGNTDYQTMVFVAGGKNIGVQVPRNQPRTMMTGCATQFSVDREGKIISAHSWGGACMGQPHKPFLP